MPKLEGPGRLVMGFDMTKIEPFENISPLNTVESRKVIWFSYFGREFDCRVEIVSSFNKLIDLFSVAVPRGENVNVTFSFSWLGFALLD